MLMYISVFFLSFVCGNYRLHSWEEYDVTNGLLICEYHDKPVNTKSPASSRRKTKFQCADELVLKRVVGLRLRLVLLLLVKGLPLLGRVVELGVSIYQLHARDEKLEPLGQVRLISVSFSQGRHAHWVVEDKGGRRQLWLHQMTEQFVVQFGDRCLYTCNIKSHH